MQEFLDKGILKSIAFLLLIKTRHTNSEIWNYSDPNTCKNYEMCKREFDKHIKILDENDYVKFLGNDKILIKPLKELKRYEKRYNKFIIVEHDDKLMDIYDRIIALLIRQEMEKQEKIIKQKNDIEYLNSDKNIYKEINIVKKELKKFDELHKIDNEKSSFLNDDPKFEKRKLLIEQIDYLKRFTCKKYLKKLLRKREVLNTPIQRNILFSYQYLSKLFNVSITTIWRIVKSIVQKGLLKVTVFREYVKDQEGKYIQIDLHTLKNNFCLFKELFIGHLYIDRNGFLCTICGSKYQIVKY